MNRNIKSVTAFVLTLLLIIASPAAAFAATEDGNITGENTVEPLLINVVLPTTIGFVLDPLGLDENNDNQIASADYFFVNQTLAPVKVELEVTATATNETAFVATTSAIEGRDDPGVTDKFVYFGALGATSILPTIATTDTAILTSTAASIYEDYFGGDSAPTGVYPSGAAIDETLIPVVPEAGGTTGSAVIGFALGAADDSTTPGAIEGLAANNDGVAAFQFYAQLNTYAEWLAGDISVTGAYTLVPLRIDTYNTAYNTAEFEVGLNQFIVTEPEPEPEPEPETPYGGIVGFIVGADTTGTTIAAVTSSKASATDISIPFYFGDPELTITSLTINTYAIPTDEYQIGSDALVLLKADATNMIRATSVSVKTMVLTLSDDSTFTFSLNVTN